MNGPRQSSATVWRNMEGRAVEIPDIDQLLNADEANVRTMREVLAGVSADLPRLLNEASVLYTTCSRSFGQGGSEYLRAMISDRNAREELKASLIRGLLLNEIGGLYAMAVADFLRMRVTAPYAYVRLQCESLALMKLMRQNPGIAEEWVAIETDDQGKRFFNKYKNQVKTVLQSYDLASAYDIASGSALHSRFIGLARRFRLSQREEGGRTIQNYTILTQEFDPKYPQYFLAEVFLTLNVQARIFAKIQDIAPEIADPILLKTRIPSFLQGINRFEAQFRQAVAQK
jgi:hypothetical protein